MIKRIIGVSNSKYLTCRRTAIIINSIIQRCRIVYGFSDPKDPTPRNKQEAWMMQEQKNLKMDITN